MKERKFWPCLGALALAAVLSVAACDKDGKPIVPPPVTPPVEPPKPPVEEPPAVDPGVEPDSCAAVQETEGITQVRASKMDGNLMLIGGTVADPLKNKAVVIMRAGNSACTTPIVGSRTVAPAAHCASNNGKITFVAAGNTYSATCVHHKEYRNNSTADFMLCYSDRTITGVAFESLATERNYDVNDHLHLMGYGCTRPGGGDFGILHEGPALVQRLPSGTNYDTVTVRPQTALCQGDSGGPVFDQADPALRRVVGVNSRGDINRTSYLPGWWLPTAQAFVKEYADARNTKICGVHSDAEGCALKMTPPRPKFVVNGKAACVEGWLKPGYETTKPDTRVKVFKALDFLAPL